MDDTKKMLTAIINGQSSIKFELMGEMKKLRLELKSDIEKQKLATHGLKKEIKKNTARIGKIGLQLACLEDDASTISEHSILEKRVKKLETKVATL